MAYPLVSINDQNLSFNDIRMSFLLAISKMKKSRYEQQLTQIIAGILEGNIDPKTNKPINPRTLTVEERYTIFLSYLDLTKDKNSVNKELELTDYFNAQANGFSKERIFTDDKTVSVRHLTGIEAEALEIGCQNTNDWILGAMAMTIGCEQLPPIEPPNSLEFCANMLKFRIDELLKLDTDEYNDLMAAYLDLQYQQVHMVNLAFDNGIVIERINLRGADDAPVRFRSSGAFQGHVLHLLHNAYEENTGL